MDMFVVPTVSFRLLYGLLVLQHARRELLWLGVTAHPSAQWVAPKRSVGMPHRDTLFATEIVPMGTPSFGVLGLWAFETDRSRRARHGRTDTWRG